MMLSSASARALAFALAAVALLTQAGASVVSGSQPRAVSADERQISLPIPGLNLLAANTTGAGEYEHCPGNVLDWYSHFSGIYDECYPCIFRTPGRECPDNCCTFQTSDTVFVLCKVNECCMRVWMDTNSSIISHRVYSTEQIGAPSKSGALSCSSLDDKPSCPGGCAVVLRGDGADPNILEPIDCTNQSVVMSAWQKSDSPPNWCGQPPGPIRTDPPFTTEASAVATTQRVTTTIGAIGVVDDPPACFPADAAILLESGRVKRMDEVQVGDRVQVGHDVFSSVFGFTHRDASSKATFVHVRAASGSSFVATPGHFVYANGGMTPVAKVRVDDVLSLSSGEFSSVTSVFTEVRVGIYNPQTLHGDIVVNGVLASTYTTAVVPAASHALLMPLRALYRALKWPLPSVEGFAPRFLSSLPSLGTESE